MNGRREEEKGRGIREGGRNCATSRAGEVERGEGVRKYVGRVGGGCVEEVE